MLFITTCEIMLAWAGGYPPQINSFVTWVYTLSHGLVSGPYQGQYDTAYCPILSNIYIYIYICMPCGSPTPNLLTGPWTTKQSMAGHTLHTCYVECGCIIVHYNLKSDPATRGRPYMRAAVGSRQRLSAVQSLNPCE